MYRKKKTKGNIGLAKFNHQNLQHRNNHKELKPKQKNVEILGSEDFGQTDKV